MKRLAMMVAVLALVMSLAACGCTDKSATNNGTTGNSGTTQNGGGTTPGNGQTGNNGSSITGQPGMNGGGNGMNSAGNGMNNSIFDDVPPSNNGGIMGDVEDTVDNVGDAVDDLIGGNNTGNNHGGATNNGAANNAPAGNGTNATPTNFQKMISNARVHDTDGVLTDDENSHW